MRLLDVIVWATGDGGRSLPHLVGYLGPPPDHAETRTLCGRRVPMARLVAVGTAAGHDLCPSCRALLALHGPTHYEDRQGRWDAPDRDARGGGTETDGGA